MLQPNDNHPLHAAIHQKLAGISAASATPPAWQEAWLGLGPEATDRERLAVYQAVRKAGSVPDDAGFFLVAWVLDLLTDERAEEGLREVEARLRTVRQKYGLAEDAPADTDDAPAEYREALQQSHDAWNALYATTLDEFGEQEMARLFRADPDQFDQRYESGRQFFHGPGNEEDDWLDELLDTVAACISPDSPMGPLGIQYREEEGFWEIWIYPTPVELVGGRHDGEVVVPGFSLDLEQLRAEFDSIAALGWNSLGLNLPEGPYIYLEGVYQGHEVYLQVLAYAPEGEEPGLKVDTSRQRRQRD